MSENNIDYTRINAETISRWVEDGWEWGSAFFVSNPYPHKNEDIEIKLRVMENEELQRVILRAKVHGANRHFDMSFLENKNGLDYYSVKLKVSESIFQYQFFLITYDEIFYYTQNGITDYLPDDSRNFKILVDYEAPT